MGAINTQSGLWDALDKIKVAAKAGAGPGPADPLDLISWLQAGYGGFEEGAVTAEQAQEMKRQGVI